jgi:uncharacterized protein
MTKMRTYPENCSDHTGVVACLRLVAFAMLMVCGMSLFSPHAAAQSLDAARASGMVGEQSDGYAVARGSATPAVRSLVNKINRERGQIYAKRAREQRISLDQVGRFYASQIAAKAPGGTWIMSPSGSWRRK